jgi:PIN domain nuclease of toxin-antitoxin system
MLILDTCALIYDALAPDRFTKKARRTLEEADLTGELACSDISLWELGMLIARDRLDPGTDALTFIQLAVDSRALRVLPITPEIAARAAAINLHADPADRIIAATAIEHGARILTSDKQLRSAAGVPTIW